MCRRMTVAVLAALALGLLVGAGPAHAQDALNCDDFANQEQAQANLAANPSDPNRLDTDNDGVACEELPRVGTGSRPAAATGPGAARSSTGTPMPNTGLNGRVSLALVCLGVLFLTAGTSLVRAGYRRRPRMP